MDQCDKFSELCAGLDETISGWRKQADEWDRKHGGPHDDECENSRLQRGHANEVAFLLARARAERPCKRHPNGGCWDVCPGFKP